MALKRKANEDWIDVKSVKRWEGGNWEDAYPDDKYTPDNPPDYNNDSIFQISTLFSTSGTFIVPKDGWYRIICIGKAGEVGRKGAIATKPGFLYSYPGTGNGAGGTGGTAVSNLYLHVNESYLVTINSIAVTFGDFLKATNGKNGASGLNAYRNNNYYIGGYGGRGGEAGIATGGNFINKSGYRGGDGGQAGVASDPAFQHPSGYQSSDGNPGEYINLPSSGMSQQSGGTGGYAGYPVIDAIKKYHYTSIQNTDVINRNLVDIVNKRVVYGTSAGYGSSSIFPGCVIIEIPVR